MFTAKGDHKTQLVGSGAPTLTTTTKQHDNDKVENGFEGFCAFPQNDKHSVVRIPADKCSPVILRGA
jgi:hypothetical protein